MNGQFLNLSAYHEADIFDPVSGAEMTYESLCRVLPPSLARLELSTDKSVNIPGEVAAAFSRYRPTPLFRARNFERAIGTDCEIYIKDEGASPTGNHKANSAYFIAYQCKQDGVNLIATETTGNWGIALAMAGKDFGVRVVCFLDHESHIERPNRKLLMEESGAEVVIVEPDESQKVNDPLTLTADAAIDYVRDRDGSYYIFGSVYSYFTIPQSVIGLEIRDQLQQSGRYPDIIVGNCGGGANLLGTSAAFFAGMMESERKVKVVSAEAESCPILSEGKMGLYSVDTRKFYPLIRTYGIEGLKDGTYIGGLGATVVASPVAFFHSQGLVEVNRFSSTEAMSAAEMFYDTEGKLVALETSYAIAAVVKQARENQRKTIVVNISSGETDRQFYTHTLNECRMQFKDERAVI